MRQLFEPRLAAIAGEERRELFSGAAALAGPVFPGLGAGVDEGALEDSYAALHGLYWLAVELSTRQPMALLVDDAHWADSASLRMLAYLVNRMEQLPLLIVVTMRPFEPGADLGLLDDIGRQPVAARLAPAPLSPAAVAELARSALSANPEPEFIAACGEATSGNPFFVRELLATLAAEKIGPTAAAAARVFEVTPTTVSRSVRRRLGSLEPAALALARAVSVLGEGVDAESAAALADLDDTAAAQAASALARADVLRYDVLEFVHPMVRAAVYSDMPTIERGAAHAKAARLLAARGADPDLVAVQLLAAPATGDAWTVEVLRRAAATATSRGVPDVATTYLRRALEEPPVDEQRFELLLELGGATQVAHGPEAFPYLREAFELAPDADSGGRVGLQLGSALFIQGFFREAAEAFERALALEPRDPSLRRALEGQLSSVLLVDLSVLLRRGGLDGVRRSISSGALDADRVALASLAWIEGASTEPAARGAELAERALDGATLTLENAASVFASSLWTLMGADRLERAREIWDETAEAALQKGSWTVYGFALTLRNYVLIRLGEVATVESDAREVIDKLTELQGLGWKPPAAVDMRLPLAWIFTPLVEALIERGELAEADATLSAAGLGGDLPELAQFNGVLLVLGRLRLSQGRADEAVQHLRECGRRTLAWGVLNPGYITWRSDLALALASTDRDEAARLAREEVELARRFDVRRALGIGLRAAGLIEGGETGLALITEAVEVLERSPAGLERARALTDLGAMLRRQGQRAKARDPLRRGLDLAQRCAASALVERAHAELVATGARPRRLVLTGYEALTPSERRVVALAAEGLTNRAIAEALFITEKTVEGHLRNAYGKLQVNSRSQLPAALEGSAA